MFTGGAGSREITRSRAVPEISDELAPVAARVGALFNSPLEDIRWSAGCFYRRLGQAELGELSAASVDEILHKDLGIFASEERAAQGIEAHLGAFTVINGSLWLKTAEPVLVVDMFGMYIPVEVMDHNSVIPPAAEWRTYSLNEASAAVEAAAELRLENDMIEPPMQSALSPAVEVMLPEVFTVLPHAERMKAIHDRAAAKAAAAVELLQNFNPKNMHEAGILLVQAAKDFNAQTRGHRIAVKASTNGGGQ